jgi:ABC-type antimicrobial peptide transport system permease subunit
MDNPEGASVYLSASALENAAFLVVRSDRPKGEMEKAIRLAIARVDPNQPVFLSASMRELISDSLADRRFIMALLAVTGCLALAMAVAGVYGVATYTTTRRTQEIGVRMPLGATPRNVQALVFRQEFLTAALGSAIGLGLALVLIRVLRGVLLGLDSRNATDLWIDVGLVLYRRIRLLAAGKTRSESQLLSSFAAGVIPRRSVYFFEKTSLRNTLNVLF